MPRINTSKKSVFGYEKDMNVASRTCELTRERQCQEFSLEWKVVQIQGGRQRDQLLPRPEHHARRLNRHRLCGALSVEKCKHGNGWNTIQYCCTQSRQASKRQMGWHEFLGATCSGMSQFGTAVQVYIKCEPLINPSQSCEHIQNICVEFGVNVVEMVHAKLKCYQRPSSRPQQHKASHRPEAPLSPEHSIPSLDARTGRSLWECTPKLQRFLNNQYAYRWSTQTHLRSAHRHKRGHQQKSLQTHTDDLINY